MKVELLDGTIKECKEIKYSLKTNTYILDEKIYLEDRLVVSIDGVPIRVSKDKE